MKLSAAQHKYLVHDQIIGAGIFNLLLNAGLTWLSFRHHKLVPMTGDPSIVGDTIGTALIMPLLICLIASPLVRKAMKAGKVDAFSESSRVRSILRWLPAWSFVRGLVLGLVCVAWFAPPLLLLFKLAGVENMSVGGYVLVKSLFAGALAAVVSPVVAMYVLATTAPVAAAAAASAPRDFLDGESIAM
jgi:hypothetical protein